MNRPLPAPTVVTVGVYGEDGASFLHRLRQADVRLLLDLRQHRGVRGCAYAWANSLRLQAALDEAGIVDEHHPELAPTTELRRLKYAEDDRRGVGKRSRRELAEAYARRYSAEILARADLAPLVASLQARDGGAALRRARCAGVPPVPCRPAAGPAGLRRDPAPVPRRPDPAGTPVRPLVGMTACPKPNG